MVATLDLGPPGRAESVRGHAHAPVSGSRPETLGLRRRRRSQWGEQAESAHIAYIALQRPVRVAIHADDMLPAA